MIRMRLSEIAHSVGHADVVNDMLITGITTDSRKVAPGMMFAALRGERADGHDFVAAALELGAAAVLASRPLDIKVPVLIVDDVVRALGLIASAWRDRIDPLVVGITGSNGKTTTKEMIANVLRLDARVLSTSGNFNNELGLPLTLFELEEDHEIAVLEMGASKAGDIEYLARIARPGVAVVTNVGPAHLRGFGNEEGVARAKGEIYASLPADGCAVINADEPWRTLWSELSNAGQTLFFGRGDGCDIYAVPDGDGHRIHTPLGSFGLKMNLPGEHNLQNALAATAIACALDIPMEQIRKGLEATRPVPGRLNLVHAEGGWTVIDDTYNANPASLYAALQVLASEPGESWLVLGDMKELGEHSRKMHAEMGDAAVSLGVKRLYAIGKVAMAAVQAFGRGARHFEDHDSLIDALRQDLHPGVTCLVKGSRSMNMERVVRAVTADEAVQEAS